MDRTVVLQFQVRCTEKQMGRLVDFITEFTKDPTILAYGTLMTQDTDFTEDETRSLMAERGFTSKADGTMEYTHKEKVDH